MSGLMQQFEKPGQKTRCTMLNKAAYMTGGRSSGGSGTTQNWDEAELEEEVERRFQIELAKLRQMSDPKERNSEEKSKPAKLNNENSNKAVKTDIFDETTSGFLSGVARVNKHDFMTTQDYGNPIHPYDPKSEGFIFYSRPNSFPDPSSPSVTSSKDEIPLLKANDALKNCDVLNVVMNRDAKCVAIVGGYESFHIQKWMRVGEHGTKLDANKYPLRMVGRARTSGGSDLFRPPDQRMIQENFGHLRKFLTSRQKVYKELKPLLEQVAKDNTIIVMTCNLGQMELLMNFVCSARSNGFDISNVLLFATDQETHNIATKLGVASYYDEDDFKNLPTKEARGYQDNTFVAMMQAKVIAVQTVNFLKYNVLFQDVDMFWYQHPLDYFHNKTSPLYDFDALFTRDGATGPRYAPYDANSGFYYIRYNERTQYMLTHTVYFGDLILRVKSHQAALQAILAEHSSLFGLRVKVLTEEEFPGGHYFHRKKDFMKEIHQKKRFPWIFHMCWTKNKIDKIKYMKQNGWWYLNEQCEDVENKKHITNTISSDSCCLKEPHIQCFYKDKPSIVPCKNSPSIDKGRPSFWK